MKRSRQRSTSPSKLKLYYTYFLQSCSTDFCVFATMFTLQQKWLSFIWNDEISLKSVNISTKKIEVVFVGVCSYLFIRQGQVAYLQFSFWWVKFYRLDLELIRQMYIIMKIVSTGHKINGKRYENFVIILQNILLESILGTMFFFYVYM